MAETPHRLPKTVRPVAYAVELHADPDRDDFAGRVRMQLEVDQPTSRIEMHAKKLDLSKAEVTVGARTLSSHIELSPEIEAVTFVTEEPVPAGRAELSVSFRGEPNPGMHGIYLARDGAHRAIATQCEATDARAIFPCFDEPEFKASLEWTVHTSRDVTALANGPLAEVEDVGDARVWRFSATEPVSSYLAALTIGHFEGTDETKVNGTPVRVWAPRGKKRQAEFAHQFTEKLIPWYESYFGISYPYGKYDQVAVPGFDAGAMENVGLVLFRQNLLLMDPGSASWNQEKLIAKVIAHELAHMWFGNLVTMKWWDDLWLNEAFAEWFAHKAVHANAPTYLVWNDFQSDKNRALVDDALPTTHSIYTPVQTPDEAIEMFDVITYQKGCAVMRMLEHFLGEGTFRDGIRTYMKTFSRGNAAGADLWHHLAEASKQPVGDLMRSWIEQSGFPLINLELDGDRLLLEQRRFFSNPTAARADNDQTWNVPMVVRYEDDDGPQEHRFILSEARGEARLPAKGDIRWCYGNAEEIGFYRVNHTGNAADALLAHGRGTLSAVEQMGFIEDQWALVRNGTNPLDRLFPVLERFAESTDHNVVRAVSDRFSTLDALLEETGEEEARESLRDRIATLFRPHLEELGYEPKKGEPQNDLQRRALAIHAVASLARRPDAVETCVSFADRERADPRSVDANLAGTFVGVAAKFGDAERYEAWEQTYRARKDSDAPPQDALRYLYTLAAFRPEELVKRTLGHLDDGLIPQEAVGSVLGQLLTQKHGQSAAWAYMKGNWDLLQARVGDMGISRVVEATGRLPGERRQEIVDFFREHPPKGAARALERALENLDQRVELAHRIGPELVRILR